MEVPITQFSPCFFRGLPSTVFSNSVDVYVMQRSVFLTDAEQRLKSLHRLLSAVRCGQSAQSTN
jgi:hypothetical protein